ncbi:MAG: restriction endonuclease subunit S [Candidatus Methylumidiphilus sp.]
MKEELPRYPAYQKSRISWANLIPVGWETGWLGECSSSIQTGPFGSQLHASDYINEGIPVINPSNIAKGKVVADWDNTVTESKAMALSRHRFQLGDIVFGRRGEMGRCAAIGQDEIGWLCGTGSLLVRLKQNRLLPDFAVLLLSQESVRDTLILESVGATMDNLNTRILAKIRIPVPPISEQVTILAFLKRETAKIDRLMDVRRKQIETLQEQRTAVIHHAVTKGIDPQAKMKPSGVEWLGDVPEEWQVYRLKYTAKIKNGQDYKAVEAEDGYPVIGSGGQFAFANQYLFQGESVLFGRKGTINKPLYINGRFWTVDTMFYTQVKECIIPKFLYYCAVGFPFEYYSTQTALPSMTQQDIGNHPIALPSLIEQERIVAYIEYETRKIDTLTTKYQRELELLAEYRAALISHAVTGKIDVRGLVEL